MSHHRFLERLRPLPQEVSAPAVASVAIGFVACPMALQGVGGPTAWQQMIYQRAFEQACAVVRPSRLERLQTATVN